MNLKSNLRYSWPLHLCLGLTNWLPDNVVFLRFRGWLCRHFLGSCGKNLRLGRSIVFYNPRDIHLGNDVYIAYGNWLCAGSGCPITLGDEVILGPKSIIDSNNHTRMNGSFRFGLPKCAPVHIGRGAWIGGNCVVTAGHTVGKGAAVGGGCVVTHDVPADCLFAGNPGKVVKNYADEAE